MESTASVAHVLPLAGDAHQTADRRGRRGARAGRVLMGRDAGGDSRRGRRVIDRSVGVRWHDRRTLEFVIGAAIHRGIPAPRTSLLQTNPILAAPASSLADRRISAGFIVEAATGTTGLHTPAVYRLLDNLPVISTNRVQSRGDQIVWRRRRHIRQFDPPAATPSLAPRGTDASNISSESDTTGQR